MTNKLYVGNLPFSATVDEIRKLFAPCGAVTDVHIATDRETRRPRGFAFITMETPEQAAAAAQQLNGRDFQGRALAVNEARPREGGPGGRDGGHRPRREFSPPPTGAAAEREGGGSARGYRGGGGGGQRRWNDAPRPNRERTKERPKNREPYERERPPRPHELGNAPEAEEL